VPATVCTPSFHSLRSARACARNPSLQRVASVAAACARASSSVSIVDRASVAHVSQAPTAALPSAALARRDAAVAIASGSTGSPSCNGDAERTAPGGGRSDTERHEVRPRDVASANRHTAMSAVDRSVSFRAFVGREIKRHPAPPGANAGRLCAGRLPSRRVIEELLQPRRESDGQARACSLRRWSTGLVSLPRERRHETTSARMDKAISCGLLAPMDKPAGERRRANCVSVTPASCSI